MNMYGYTGNDPVNFVDPFGKVRVCTTFPGGIITGQGEDGTITAAEAPPIRKCTGMDLIDTSGSQNAATAEQVNKTGLEFASTYAAAVERQQQIDSCLAGELDKLSAERREITAWYINEGLTPPNWKSIDALKSAHKAALETMTTKTGLGALTGGAAGPNARGGWGAAWGFFFGAFEITLRGFSNAFNQAKDRPQNASYTPEGYNANSETNEFNLKRCYGGQ